MFFVVRKVNPVVKVNVFEGLFGGMAMVADRGVVVRNEARVIKPKPKKKTGKTRIIKNITIIKDNGEGKAKVKKIKKNIVVNNNGNRKFGNVRSFKKVVNM